MLKVVERVNNRWMNERMEDYASKHEQSKAWVRLMIDLCKVFYKERVLKNLWARLNVSELIKSVIYQYLINAQPCRFQQQ